MQSIDSNDVAEVGGAGVIPPAVSNSEGACEGAFASAKLNKHNLQELRNYVQRAHEEALRIPTLKKDIQRQAAFRRLFDSLEMAQAWLVMLGAEGAHQ